MNAGQYEGIMGALGEILDRMPVREIPLVVEPVAVRKMDGSRSVVQPLAPEYRRTVLGRQADKRQALAIMRAVLDDWIKGAKENHEACAHRHENRGEECWRTFHAQDIRNMINDAARELGVDEFPLPEDPKEGKA